MLIAPLLLLFPAAAQEQPASTVAPIVTEPEWTTSLATYWIEPPHDSGYLSAIVAADRGALHLEAHWAYEDRDTLSVFVGKSFPIEGDLEGSVTPRIGIAGGDSDGIVPAVGLDLAWDKLSFYTDVEYLIATSDDTDDFLYAWSELAWAFTDRFSAGIVGERTNAFDQELSVDRGLLLGMNFGRTQLTVYAFNLDVDDPYVTIALSAGF